MNDFRSIGVPAEGGGSDIGRKALWVIRELGLPALVKACVSCRSARHHPTGKFRVNANGKLLDVWMLICCELCGRTSKIPLHERIYVQALDSERLLMFENNDRTMVRDLAMDGALAGKAAYQLDWSGTWELENDMLSCELEPEDPAPLKVIIRFELPVPIRVEKLLVTGVRPEPILRERHGRFRTHPPAHGHRREGTRRLHSLCVATPPPSLDAAADQEAPPWAWRRRQPPRTCWQCVTARSRRAGVVLEMEQDRIVWDAGLAKPLGSGGSPGKTHCYQGLTSR